MGYHVKPIATAILTISILAGCTNQDGSANQPVSGAVIGGLTGAAAGQIIGGDTRATVIGGVVGAAVGGAIGARMAAQERELRQSLAGTGAAITNTGSDLRVILPESVTFRTGSSVVDTGFRPALRVVADSLRRHPNSGVRVVGHTDNVGSAALNNQLSQDRAMAVARVLIQNGVSSNRIVVAGRGFYEPVASNASVSGRAENRRVEIVITPRN
ncbi:OmpA family protein [Roseinatronobacter alkalisoli]|uniref:OmpA family protein n=1 Tax=Roseinatronobacter alkalisoli TaxID=3028235 RepID=A0ABT5TBW8_9RHOB|nr:OmpA family protein [Roseinatronobacter sp. HJB301]MDD7972185.1 OmpA family protein [Roseinatronobacter sp. HJB301]